MVQPGLYGAYKWWRGQIGKVRECLFEGMILGRAPTAGNLARLQFENCHLAVLNLSWSFQYGWLKQNGLNYITDSRARCVWNPDHSQQVGLGSLRCCTVWNDETPNPGFFDDPPNYFLKQRVNLIMLFDPKELVLTNKGKVTQNRSGIIWTEKK